MAANNAAYRSPRLLANCSILLLALHIIISLAGLSICYKYGAEFKKIEHGLRLEDSAMQYLDDAASSIDDAGSILVVITAIPFSLWLMRCRKNLPFFGNSDFKYKPYEAALGFFVPFIWFYRPIQVTKEVINKTYGAARAKNIISLSHAWWAFWIIMNLFGRIVSSKSNSVKSISELRNLTDANIFSSIVDIIAAILAIILIIVLSKEQEKRAQDTVTGESLAPTVAA